MLKAIQFVAGCVLFTALLAVGAARADVSASWSTNADGDWSVGANWDGGSAAIGAAGTASFTNAITANRIVTVDSSPWTIGNLTFTNTGIYGWTITNGILNLAGATITVNAGSTATIASAISNTVGLTKGGDGTINFNGTTTLGSLVTKVNTRSGSIIIGNAATLSVGTGSSSVLTIGNSSGQSDSTSILDASASPSVIINVGTIALSKVSSTGQNSVGTLKLGLTNTITASTGITIALAASTNPQNTGTVTTATNSTTTIYTPSIQMGGYYGNGTFRTGSGSTITIAGISGGRTSITLNDHVRSSWSESNSDIMDLSGSTASLMLNSLKVVPNANYSSDTVTGTFTMSTNIANHLDISGAGNTVIIGSGSAGTVNATNTIGYLDATSAITSTDNSTAILIANSTGGTINGTLNLLGGTLTITTTGSAIGSSGSNGTSRLNLNNFTLIAGASSTNWMSGLTVATLTNNVTFNTGTNSIVIPQAFSGNGCLIKSGAGMLTLGGSNTYSGSTAVSNGTLLVDGMITNSVTAASRAAFGGTGIVRGNVELLPGASAVFTQGAPLTIAGSFKLNNNTVRLILPDGLTNGVYRLANFNASGSSGKFAPMAVIDSGSALGLPTISMGAGTVDLKVVVPGTVIVVR